MTWLYVYCAVFMGGFLVVIVLSALEIFHACVKPEITPPCVECRSHVESHGLHMCGRSVSEVDGRPLLCSLSRDGFRCKFERKEGGRG